MRIDPSARLSTMQGVVRCASNTLIVDDCLHFWMLHCMLLQEGGRSKQQVVDEMV